MNIFELGFTVYLIMIYSCLSVPLGKKNLSNVYAFFDWMKTTSPNPHTSTTKYPVQFIPSNELFIEKGKKKVKKIKRKKSSGSSNDINFSTSARVSSQVTSKISEERSAITEPATINETVTHITSEKSEESTAITVPTTLDKMVNTSASLSYNITCERPISFFDEYIPDGILESLTEVVLTTTESSFNGTLGSRLSAKPRNGYGGYNNQSYGSHYLSDLAVLFLALIPIALVLGAAAAFALNGSSSTTNTVVSAAANQQQQQQQQQPNNNNANQFPIIILNFIPEETTTAAPEEETTTA
ncbi:uncharacterized protein LOC136041110 isoform X2 [Artemia franciscana]|uniref:uncharacterized protein LOC136041110 isoform X2 n=1 Tax=Artemia franciscana TaxID=6661 RepID=UPI0032D9BADB